MNLMSRWLNNEKPLSLEEFERDFGKKVYNILQLRLHPSLIDLHKKVKKTQIETKYEVDLTYITSRGNWYFTSWKGDESKSGGIATNIGIHFFDMLIWLFGNVHNYRIIYRNDITSLGELCFENGSIAEWKLSIDRNELPDKSNEMKFFRSISINNKEVRFDDIIGDYHTLSYKEIFNGNGFTINDVKPSIELLTKLRGNI